MIQHIKEINNGFRLVEITKAPLRFQDNLYVLTIVEDISKNAEISMEDGNLLADFMSKNIY